MIPTSTWPKGGAPLWRVALEAPDEFSAEGFAQVLEALGGAISAFETEPQGPWKVETFVQGKPDLAVVEGGLALVALQFGVVQPAVTLEQLPDVDWVRQNQESFPPLHIGRYFVYGSHIVEPPPAGTIGLEIDAASAFGTGEHATTAGCLLALDRLAKRGPRRRVLDMGSGTGILAIAAAKTWHVSVLACDIDRNSVRVAAENVVTNGVQHLVVSRESDGYRAAAVSAAGPYDLIFANILARPLAKMAPDLAHHLAPGGIAILSGLLARQETYVAAAHRNAGLTFKGRIPRAGWHTLVFEKAWP
ncbi:ribosomal protein L11 methyltransferase [Aliidongia dinghuensis]|uniref:Ribosomal protein L11 methyltransferase n=1 Tax=Aliidongia dinghuensis TaxID=1867774 RepID=A0A8J2YTN5_9PROT|nr:50S ribosomal protein L11 methyltransferase [Aliidongia dinghuensis]GGF17267.1 ribosomal protein L11 methyltransferase [Aliidongia dinghuensis]